MTVCCERSAIFACVDANDDDFNVIAFDVSYPLEDEVDSTDSILIHIYNYVDDHRYWFMIGNVQVRCLGMFFLSLDCYQECQRMM